MPKDLESRLLALDIDEGIRIEASGSKSKTNGSISLKMYVNRRPSGTYIIQYGDIFYYPQSAKKVMAIIGENFLGHFKIWAY